jgi:hypothetical protein
MMAAKISLLAFRRWSSASLSGWKGYSTYFVNAQTAVTAPHASASNAVYLTGSTGSTAFPTIRPYQAAYGGGSSDAFIATLAPSEPRVFITSRRREPR